MGEGHHEGRHTFPGAEAEALRPLPAVGHKDLPFPQVAGMLDGVFISGDQIVVAGCFHNGDAAFFHMHILRSADENVFYGYFTTPDGRMQNIPGFVILITDCRRQARCIIIKKKK